MTSAAFGHQQPQIFLHPIFLFFLLGEIGAICSVETLHKIIQNTKFVVLAIIIRRKGFLGRTLMNIIFLG